MKRGTITAVAVGLASIACASGALDSVPSEPRLEVQPVREGATGSQIAGFVVDQRTGDAIEGAVVVLECTCLTGSRETQTNKLGLFAFRGLEPGTYTVGVFHGTGERRRTFQLAPGVQARLEVRIDPTDRMIRT